jgi:hypothetical protein
LVSVLVERRVKETAMSKWHHPVRVDVVSPLVLRLQNYTTILKGVYIYSARQPLARHVPKRYAVNKNRRPLLDNGFGYHGTKYVSGTTHA